METKPKVMADKLMSNRRAILAGTLSRRSIVESNYFHGIRMTRQVFKDEKSLSFCADDSVMKITHPSCTS